MLQTPPVNRHQTEATAGCSLLKLHPGLLFLTCFRCDGRCSPLQPTEERMNVFTNAGLTEITRTATQSKKVLSSLSVPPKVSVELDTGAGLII